MQISIPLFSIPLLVSALLIGLGLLATPFSARLSAIGIGLGSVIMGGIVFTNLPKGFELKAIALFGVTVIVGAWMVAVGLKKQPGE
jgi:hypothetical protein